MSLNPSKIIDPEGGVAENVALFAKLGLLLIGIYFAIMLGSDFVIEHLPDSFERDIAGKIDLGTEPTDDPAFQRAAAIFKKVTAFRGRRDLPFRLVYLDEPEPNAFAVPGGTVGVTKGLLAMVKTDIGLAFVLGHEIGHHQHRDSTKALSRQLLVSFAASLLSGGGLTFRLAELAELRNSRAQELSADRFAFQLVRHKYGTTKGITEFFDKLKADEAYHTSLPKVFMTHPYPEERIARLRAMSTK